MYDYTTTSSSGDPLAFIFPLCCCVIMIPLIAFWIWMLIDAIKREYPADRQNDKIVWILVVALAGWVGALVYYFVIKQKSGPAVVSNTPNATPTTYEPVLEPEEPKTDTPETPVS
jgi:uncharacterized membrane protein YsdA (DUF1294 family)